MRPQKLVFVLIVVLTAVVFPQDYLEATDELETLDNFVHEGNQLEATNQTNRIARQLNAYQDTLLTDMATRIQQYLLTLNNVSEGIHTGRLPANKYLTDKYRTRESLFINNVRGPQTETAFKEFRALADSGQYKEALLAYRRADYSRKLYMDKQILNILAAVQKANDLYQAEELDSALQTLENIKSPWKPNAIYLAKQKETDFLKLEIKKSRYVERQHERNWQQREIHQRRFSITGGVGLFKQPNVTEARIVTAEGFRATVEELPARYRTGYALGIEYAITSKLHIGITAQALQYLFTNETNTLLYKVEYKIAARSGHIYGKYLTRAYVGLQPFAEAGIGFTQLNRRNSSLDLVFFPSDPSQPSEIITFPIDESSGSTMQFAAGVGIQYVGSADSRVSFGFKFLLHQNSQVVDLVDKSAHSFTGFLRLSF